jgi:hypothetical protein
MIAVFELNCFFNFRQTFVAQKSQLFASISLQILVSKTDKTISHVKSILHHFFCTIFYKKNCTESDFSQFKM